MAILTFLCLISLCRKMTLIFLSIPQHTNSIAALQTDYDVLR